MEVPADCIESVEKSIRGTGACLQPYVDEQENLKDKVDILTENLEKVRQDNFPESVNDRYHEELDFGSISDNE